MPSPSFDVNVRSPCRSTSQVKVLLHPSLNYLVTTGRLRAFDTIKVCGAVLSCAAVASRPTHGCNFSQSPFATSSDSKRRRRRRLVGRRQCARVCRRVGRRRCASVRAPRSGGALAPRHAHVSRADAPAGAFRDALSCFDSVVLCVFKFSVALALLPRPRLSRRLSRWPLTNCVTLSAR